MYRNRAVDVSQRTAKRGEKITATDESVNLKWRDAGACRSHPLDLFCHGCPVQQSCRQHAIFYPENYGIWGGLNPVERIASGAAPSDGQRER